MMKIRLLGYFFLGCAFVSGCAKGEAKEGTKSTVIDEDLAPLLESAVGDVIVPTYRDMLEKVTALSTCAGEFEADPTEEGLTACRERWIDARVPWERSEGFLFGPVTNLGLDPAMDSWPVDSVQLDALMDSDVDLSAETIQENLGGGLKGFHTIEYLLWGSDHEQTAAALAKAPRRVSYLVALTQALQNDTQTLVDAWVGTDAEEGYGPRFVASGSAGAVYARQVDAALELGGALSGICDEVANGKIAEPYKAADPALVESQFSDNSIPDFVDNMRSIRNIYYGTLDGSVAENSFSALVARNDPDVDDLLRARIEDAIEKVGAIEADGVPFRDAISDPEKAAVIEAAQTAVNDLYTALRAELEPLFAN